MARDLEAQENVDSGDAENLSGKIRDNTGIGDGTPVNEALYGDMHQFFAKLMRDAGITPNNLIENTTNGFQLNEAFDKVVYLANENLRKKIIEIGDWDMDTDSQATVAHGLDLTKIREVSIIVRENTGVIHYPLNRFDTGSGTSEAGIQVINNNIVMGRATGSFFDSASFNSTGFNRGWITITHVAS